MEDAGEISWISWFCGLNGNDIFVKVPKIYIQEKVNLFGLANLVPYYQEALHRILDDKLDDQDDKDEVEQAAEVLYGLIHARYIMTQLGIDKMEQKYEAGGFGFCRRVYCKFQPMLPIGLDDRLGKAMVKVYCPRCMEVCKPKSCYQSIDGAFFGTGFAHMFLMMRPKYTPRKCYEARLYGFKIHPSAYELQQQQHQ